MNNFNFVWFKYRTFKPSNKLLEKFFLYVPENEEIELLKTIGNSVRKLRTQNKISQAQLAFEVKTDGRHIRRIENGEVKVSFITLHRISKVLGVTVNDLYTQDNENL